VALISLFVLMGFVIPRFIPLFEDMGSALPMLTRIVFAAAESFRAVWWLAPALSILGQIGAQRWLGVDQNRKRAHGWIVRAPLIGSLVQAAETARFARTLATLLRNGLPLLTALKLAKDVLRNDVHASAVERCAVAVRSGGRLAASLGREEVFPSLAVELIMVGEESGQLEAMLDKTADNFDAKVQQALKRLLTLLEPVSILGLGGLIAIIITAVLMAMLGLNELVV
jgi:general secretion pathway protein F